MDLELSKTSPSISSVYILFCSHLLFVLFYNFFFLPDCSQDTIVVRLWLQYKNIDYICSTETRVVCTTWTTSDCKVRRSTTVTHYNWTRLSRTENFRSERARVTGARFGGRCVNVVRWRLAAASSSSSSDYLLGRLKYNIILKVVGQSCQRRSRRRWV